MGVPRQDITMPVCCWCNGSGRCRNCACVKSGRPCVDCLPTQTNEPAPGPSQGPSPTPTPVSCSVNTNSLNGPTNSSPPSQSNEAMSNTSADNISDDEVAAEHADPVHTPPGDYLSPYPQFCHLCFKWSSIDGPTFVKS